MAEEGSVGGFKGAPLALVEERLERAFEMRSSQHLDGVLERF